MPVSHAALLYAQWTRLPSIEQLQKVAVIVPGMDHSAFCPGFNVSGDHPSEIPEAIALATIASVAASWMDVVLLGPSARSGEAAADLPDFQVPTEPL